MNHLSAAASDKLVGYVAIDTSNEESNAIFEHILSQLRTCGWEIGGKACHIELAAADGVNVQTLEKATIIRCETAGESECFKAISADAFAILTRLGGGGMEQVLAKSIEDELIVDKVLVGLNWSMVRAGELCGIARSPARGTEGARTIRPEEGLAGKSLKQMANYLCSSDPLQRSLGLAAVNAYWNRPRPLDETKKWMRKRGGFSALAPPGDGLVIVGGFREAARRLPAARIVEREPKPGDIPVAEAPAAFAQAKQLAITAQTLMNGSLEPILKSSQMVPYRMLIGPSAPLCPRLFNYGLDEISGAVVIDPEATEQFILETGTMVMLEHLMKKIYLRSPNVPVPGFLPENGIS